MAYTNQAAVERTAGGPSVLVDIAGQDDAGTGAVNAGALAQAITDTDGLIDSYVAKQRAVPLNPVPATIARLAAQEVVWLLKSQMPSPPISEIEQLRHEANIKWLQDVAAGRVTLGVDPQPAKSALVAPAVVTVDDATAEITAKNTVGFW